jgi:hypothetical protein
MYHTRGAPGADLHAMFQNDLVFGQVGFVKENEGFSPYGSVRLEFGERRGLQVNVSGLVNYGLGVARAPEIDPDEPEELHPGDTRVDKLRYGLAANVRWKALDVYAAIVWDRVFGLPGRVRGFDRTATGLTVGADYLVHEHVMLSGRFDQMWAGGLRSQKADASVFTAQAKYYPWLNIAFFVRDSVNLKSFREENPLRSFKNQVFVGIDWDF